MVASDASGSEKYSNSHTYWSMAVCSSSIISNDPDQNHDDGRDVRLGNRPVAARPASVGGQLLYNINTLLQLHNTAI